MFGLMAWLDIPLNPANMIVLPLILGIGMDYGVHIVHDYRQQTGRYALRSSIAVAILLGALTTIVGFGSLMIANHRGLESLGRVLTIGVSACLFNSFIMLPALLAWMSEHRLRETGASTPVNDEAEPAAVPLAQPIRRMAADEVQAPRRRAA
jgi:predicted RND superfamily exporter protein